jgi:hypothetical protein
MILPSRHGHKPKLTAHQKREAIRRRDEQGETVRGDRPKLQCQREHDLSIDRLTLRGTVVRFLRIASWLGFFILFSSAGAQEAQPNIQNIDNIVNLWVKLCVGGGHVEALTAGGSGGADISLRSLDVKGHLAGEVTVSRSNAEGLVKGIDNAMSQVAAAEADKVRICLQPVRERLLDIMLPAPKAKAPPPPLTFEKLYETAFPNLLNSEEKLSIDVPDSIPTSERDIKGVRFHRVIRSLFQYLFHNYRIQQYA